MTMLFRDIIEECRIRGVKAAEWIESFLFREVFNQPLRIVYNIIQEEDSKMNMNTGLYNTLSPYLFDAAYHLTPVRAESMIIEKVALKDNSHLRDESGQNHLTPISEEKQEIQAEAEQDPFVNDMPENIITETFLASERPSDNPEQPLVSVPEKTAKKVKKEKKQKKKSYPSVGLSGFALWLLDQKPLEDQKVKWRNKSGKKDKINESAQKSITPSDEIISESLALILTKQGHYLEAKKMYKKLMIKFPEKTADFESEIEKLNGFL